MAANGLSVEVRGVEGLLGKLRALVPRVRAGVQNTVAQTALLVESDAKRLAPVDTGRLRSSIHADIAPKGLTARVAADANYAVFVEFGTRYTRAQPFLGPAYEKNRGAFVALLKANTKLF